MKKKRIDSDYSAEGRERERNWKERMKDQKIAGSRGKGGHRDKRERDGEMKR